MESIQRQNKEELKMTEDLQAFICNIYKGYSEEKLQERYLRLIGKEK